MLTRIGPIGELGEMDDLVFRFAVLHEAHSRITECVFAYG
jgi:hypothetical protein